MSNKKTKKTFLLTFFSICAKFGQNLINSEYLSKLLEARGNRHSGQAKRDPESRIFQRFCPPEADGFRRNDGLSNFYKKP